VKAIILDMYGVILKDPGDGFYTYVNKSFPDLSVEDIYGHWLNADLGEISTIEVLKRIGYKGDLAKIEKDYLDTVEIDNDFYEFAGWVKQKHKLALISNDSSEWSKFFREKYNLDRYFDVISVSGDLKMKKPELEIFLLTLEKLDCRPEECIFIDDRVRNLQAAESIGMKAILFNSRSVSYEGKQVTSFEQLQKMIDENLV